MDSTQVDQVLINLAVNARDAITDVGTLIISTENRLQEEAQPSHGGDEGPRDWVIMTVTDTGRSMGSESLAHLFEPFFTTEEIGKGTGMGLATVYGNSCRQRYGKSWTRTTRNRSEAQEGEPASFRRGVPAEPTRTVFPARPRAPHLKQYLCTVTASPPGLIFES